MLLGFDVGGTNVRLLLIEPRTGEVLDRDRESSAGPGPVLLETLIRMSERMQMHHGGEISAIGLGVAGLAHRSGIIRYSPNLPELIEYPLGSELAAATKASVQVMNDATAAAWAEAKFGGGRGSDDFILAALGTGIGTGFVCGGHLIHGHNGFAGETGHMVVDANGPMHHTGQQGPWEYYASGSALGLIGRSQAAAGLFPVGLSLAGSVTAIDGFTVAEALARGDKQAQRIFDGFCRQVAQGLANLVMIFDPERILLGGGLTDIGEPLRAGVQSWLERLTLGSVHRPAIDVVMAELGDDAGALGAALWAQGSVE
ncbi:MAG: ROK family protein [Acidimicrobiaceae bacterium]|jgi:glucokinase|nr:ROK family protein [Acidimicrobiaceae bacterium]